MVSSSRIGKVFGLVSLGCFVSIIAGCLGEEADESWDVPPSLQLQEPGPKEQKLLTRSCGNHGDHMIASYTHEYLAEVCPDTLMINGTSVKGQKAYNEQDKRWSLSFNIPEGATSGDVVVKCNGEEINLGRLEIPCPLLPPSGNAFQSWGGELKMAQGCDDNDYKVTIGEFTDNTFVMTGLANNGPITFTLTDANVAVAENVTQYAKGGHTVKLTLDRTSGKIRFQASSPEGSCNSTLSR